MEAIAQNRRESPSLRVHHEKSRFFQQERVCQYEPYSDVNASPVLFFDGCRQLIKPLIWPRLVVIRVKHVLTELMPLLNLTEEGAFGVCLHGVSSVLSPIGWVLHGLRLLINLLALIQHAIGAGNDRTWFERAGESLHHHGVTMGNDLIWVVGAIVPNTAYFTCGLLVVDLFWLFLRAEFDKKAVSLTPEENTAQHHAWMKKLRIESQKFSLNLVSLLSINAVGMLKHFILPAYFPVLATNPLLLLALSLLSLAITIASHVFGLALSEQVTNVSEASNNGLGAP